MVQKVVFFEDVKYRRNQLKRFYETLKYYFFVQDIFLGEALMFFSNL
jgi:hypothetical protein